MRYSKIHNSGTNNYAKSTSRIHNDSHKRLTRMFIRGTGGIDPTCPSLNFKWMKMNSHNHINTGDRYSGSKSSLSGEIL